MNNNLVIQVVILNNKVKVGVRQQVTMCPPKGHHLVPAKRSLYYREKATLSPTEGRLITARRSAHVRESEWDRGSDGG